MNENESRAIYRDLLNRALIKAKTVFFNDANNDAPGNISELAEKRMYSPALLSILARPGGISAQQLSETIESEFDKSFDEALIEMLTTSRYRQILYQTIYNGLQELYMTEESWEKLLILAKHSGDEIVNEIFVRLVEENTGESITSYQQLQKATGIYNLNDVGYIKKEINAPEDWEPTEKVTKAEAESRMEICFFMAMRHRYRLALEEGLRNGGKYPDLLKINPTTFYLPNKIQEPAIIRALETYICDLPIKPDIRSLAESLEAPYSLLIKAKQLPEKAV
jgi:hypothetical protein